MENNTVPIMEGYPDHVIKRFALRDERRKKALPEALNGHPIQLVLEDLLLWNTGVLTVSFKGGTAAVHKNIADIAATWSKHANIQFDFGQDSASGSYRVWVPGDTSSIRVGFEAPGYWSFVGTDSLDLEICNPGEITLNLEKFDVSLPRNWQATVLHEFGHALGFHHEHQSPVSKCDFDWDTLYAYLAGPPNFWPKEQVDFNLRQMPAGGLTYSPYDKLSVMHYSFPEWMFLSGASSPCYVEENTGLSEEDKKMAEDAYPFKEDLLAEKRMRQRERIIHILKHPKAFSAEENVVLNSRVQQLNTRSGQMHSFMQFERTTLNNQVKKAILVAGGQAAEEPGNLADNIAIGNLLATDYAYQFLADLLDELVKTYNQDASVKITDVSNADTVLECIQMVQGKI